ncbi:MAG: BCCT family transporter [Hyphomicrobiales bacterium]
MTHSRAQTKLKVVSLSLIIIVILVLTIFFAGRGGNTFFSSLLTNTSNNVGWFYIFVLNFVFFFAIVLAFGRFRNIRIGGKNAKPEFSRSSWLAMLFSAGVGIGLLFYGVAEPVLHYHDNPFSMDGSIESANTAMSITFIHWGIHAWSLYTIVALALAFFAYNMNLPLTMRSVFYPLLKDRIYGWIGNLIDVFAIVATIFGLSASLGLGAKQIGSGMEYVFGLPSSTFLYIVLIVIITGLAIMSLLLGLKKGIKILSEINMAMAIILLLFIFIAGPTVYLFKAFFQNVGNYLFDFFKLSLWNNAYSGIKEGEAWQDKWTIFYYSWWIAWTPFVGIFIARISKGRTLKEFILAVILVPSTFTFLWFTVFGSSSIYHEILGDNSIYMATKTDVSLAIFKFLEKYPITFISSIFTMLLIASFFVTSSDSGTYVVDTLASNGKHNSHALVKIFWASLEGFIAAFILVIGGLNALRVSTVMSSVPFSIIVILLCFSLYKALRQYKRAEKASK